MADIQANIGINLDTSRALAQLKNLQRQISVFNTEIARGGGKAAVAAAGMQQELVNSINATGQFSASMTSVRSTTEAFTNALEKNKLSLGQTFRYAGASTKKFSHLFTSEFNTIEKVARERVKTIQTQYIKMGRDANGAIRSIAVRPLALDMNNLATQTAMAAQKQQILNQLLRQGSTNLLNWGKNTQWAGRQLMVGFTIPLALFGAAASKSFMELEEQAIRFKRVYGDLFTTPQQADQAFADMQRLGQEFTKYGVAVEKTIGLAASVAQMGKTGAELTAQVTEATRLAVLGGMEQEDALNTTISLTNAFGVAAADLTDKINFLNAAENQTILSIQDFNEAVPRAGSVVAQLGGDVEDLAFFLTAMREGGIEASQGANALKTSLGRLVNPTRRAREELMAYGIDVVGIVERNAGNLRQTVLDLGMALDQLDPLEKSRAVERLFGKFQFARMSALFNNIMDEGSQAATILDLINSSASDLSAIAGRELGRVEESAATKFRAAIEQFQAALAPIGESFLKLVTPIIEFGTKVLNAFNNLGDGTKAFVVGLVATLGAIGPVLIMTVGLLANGIANLMKIFLGLQSVFQKIRGGTKSVADQTEYMTQQQLEAAAAAASLNQSHSTLQQTFTSELAAVNNLVAAYQRMTTAQRNSLGIPQVISSTSSAPGFAKGRKVPGYKDGVVMVPGPKGAGDIQPAMLAPGEAVIPAAMAEKYGPLINAMIAGNIPGYVVGKTKKTSGQTSYDASHFAGEDIRDLSAKVMRLAEAGEYVETTVFRMTETADGLGRVFQKVTGYLHELIQEGDVLTASGQTYSGTTIPATSERNQGMNNAFGFSGEWATTEELFKQEEVLLAEKKKNSEKYREHSASIDALLLEAKEARSLIAQSNDQEAAKLAIETERAKIAVKQKLIAHDGMDADQAEAQATKMVSEAEEVYYKKILEGVSQEEALQAASDRLAKIRLSLAESYYAAPEGTPTDALRSPATGRGIHPSDPVRQRRRASGLSTSTPAYVSHVDESGKKRTGQLWASQGKPMSDVMSKFGAEIEQNGFKLFENAAKRLAAGVSKAAKSQSPSRAMEQESKNIVDGAVKAVREGQDDMQQAGSQLAQATEQGFNNFGASGTSSRTRGAPSRVRTAGEFTTPGQPPAFDIAGGKEIQAAQQQLAVSARMSSQNISNLAVSAINGANKIGSIGIAVSSLAGGLTMVEGPLGEFASKLFPITSIITGLSFAMNFLSAETVKHNIANAASRIAQERNTAATIINTRATQAETVAKTVNAGATSVVTGTVNKIGTGFSNLGTRIVGFARAVGSAALGLLGISASVGLVVAGLALLAGGTYLLYKVINDQREKVSGLGDAASLSSEKLKVLNDALGTSISAIEYSPIGSSGGAVVSGAEEEATARSTQATLQESDEFKTEYKGVISAIGGASQAAATQALTSMAIALQAGGAEEEVVAGIVNAILAEAGRTDVEIQFANLTVADATESAAQAAQNFAEGYNFVDNASSGFGAGSYEAGAFDTFSQADLELAAGAMTSAIGAATAQLDSGAIGLDEYNAEMQKVQDTMSDLSASGPDGLAAAARLAEEMGNNLEEAGLEGISDEISSFVDNGIGTQTGVDSATAIMQARAAGTDISESEMQALQAGSAEGADERVIRNAQRTIDAIEKRTESTREATEAQKKFDDAVEATEEFSGRIGEENEALQQQIDTYDEVSAAIAGNSEIVDKAGFAQKIANDETLRAEWANAQLAGTTDQFIASLQEQTDLQNEIAAATALIDAQQEIRDLENKKIATEGLTTALGDSAVAQELMGNASFVAGLMAKLAADNFDIATASAEALVEKLNEPAYKEFIDTYKALVAALGETKVTSGSGGGTPKSFLDDIVKGLRDVASGQTTVTNGFRSSLRALVAFSKAGVKGLNGLSSQLRRAGVTGTFAEKILGMDPKDWEKQKRQLFNFNAAGNITGLTAAGEAVKEALGVVEIGKFIDEQQSLTVSVGEQIEALNRLTGAGASYEAAYEAVQNKAFASAVATAKSTELITAAAQEAMAAMAKMKELEEINEEEERRKRISEAIREQNKEFSNQAKILDHINKSNYSEAQINEILNNKDLQSLVLEPSIDPGALSTALANAQKQADLELRIKKLTVEGQEDIFQEGVSNAMSAFGALEEQLELEFKAKIKDDGSLVQDAERQIALIDFELDDYQAGLDEIDRLEQDINDVYDKRIEALDEVATLNEDIARSQESQLEIADALSKGDIAAAARAAQQSRQVQQESAREAQQRMLEEQRASEIARLRSSGGMTREDLQDRIRDLEEQIFNIEEKTLEPAQERIRLAEITRDDRIADLQVLGKTREEWDKISNSVDVAQANGWRFADAMQEALNIVEKLVDNLTNRPAPPPPPPPPPAPSSGGGGGGGPELERKSQWTFGTGANIPADMRGKKVEDVAKDKGYAQWQDFYNENRGIDQQIIPKIKRAYGGMVGRARSGPPQQYFDGGKVSGPGTEKSDSIPALLSNGEYVIRASSVRLLGKDFLDKLNGGKVGPVEKDGMPGYFLGGFVDSVKSFFAPKPTPKPSTSGSDRAMLLRAQEAQRKAQAAKPSLPRPPLISAGKNPPPPVQTRRPSTASAPRTTAPAPAPRPAPAPAVMTQDTRTPLAKALDNVANTMRQSGISNYLPDPKKAIRDAVDFFMPFTSESMKESDDGLPTASGVLADAALFGAGSLIGRVAQPIIGAISKAVKVPTVAVPGATAAATSTATRTSSRSIMDVIREETQNLAAGTRFIGSRPAPFGKPVNFDDTKLNFEANFQTKKAANFEQSKQIEDYVVDYARQNNKTIVEAITDANDFKLMDNVFPEDFNTYGDQVYLINQIDELEALLAKPPVEAQAIEKILPAQGYLDSKILAPFRAMDRLFASKARTQSAGFSQLGNSRVYQSAVKLLPPNLRAMALTATARHRSASSVLGDPGNLLHPRDVPIVSGRAFGPSMYFAQTQKLSDEIFGVFGENAYRVGMSPAVLKRLFSSKGYITPTELRKRGLSIGWETSYDDATIRTLMNEGYVGYQHGDALTSWLVGADDAFKLVPTTAKAIADSGASLRSRLDAVQQYMKFFENAKSQQKLLSANPATSIPRISLPFTPKARPVGTTKPTQSSEFIQGSSLKRLKDAPKDVEYEPGAQMMVSSFAKDSSGNKFFVKGHLHESWETGEPDTVNSSFVNEFLAGRIGNYIGANTPQSYIIQRSAKDVAIGSNMRSNLSEPFEIATSVVPSSHSLDPEYMRTLVLMSDNPYKTIEELFDGFVDYSRTTPALNAVMGNSDLHYNNILWSNATKKFNQIDFNEAKPVGLKMAPGIPGTHPQVRDALVIAKSSMALVRESLNDAVEAALENQLLTQSQQLALIGKMNASGFKLTANKNATDPLSDTVLDITTTQDYTKLFEKIASSDGDNYIPRALEGEWRGIKGGTRVVDPWVLKDIQERAEVLSEFGRISLDVGDYGMMAQRMAVRGKGFMAGGFVKSVNSDNIPAMLTAGEYVVKRSAVQNFGASNLEKINNGTYNDGSVYNYNLAVNVKSDADPNKIARTVITNIKGIENQRVRGNKL